MTAPTLQTAQYEDDLAAHLDFRGLRMPVLALDQMLGAAFAHIDRHPDALPPLDAVHLRLEDDLLTLTATDRYTAYREQRAVNQQGAGSTFLLQADDLRTIRSLLRSGLAAADKPDKPVLPVDVLLGDTGFLEVVVAERRVVCAPRDARDTSGNELPFPDIARLIADAHSALEAGTGPFEVGLNADLVARVKPLQKAGYKVFRFRRGLHDAKKNPPVLLTPLAPHEEFEDYGRLAEVLVMPVSPIVPVDERLAQWVKAAVTS